VDTLYFATQTSSAMICTQQMVTALMTVWRSVVLIIRLSQNHNVLLSSLMWWVISLDVDGTILILL